MSEISRVIGGSKATLYGYFRSKEELFAAAVDLEGARLLQALVDDLGRREVMPLRETLLAVGEALVLFLDSEPALATYRMVISEAGRSPVGEHFFEQGPGMGLAQLARLLNDSMERGELRTTDSHLAALHLHGLLSSELLPRLFNPTAPSMSPAAARGAAHRAVDVFLAGYSAGRFAA